MDTRRWTNPSQPQTMQIAVFLLYFGAVFTLLLGSESDNVVTGMLVKLGIEFVWLDDIIRLLLGVGAAVAGFGIANEKKQAYLLGLVVAAAPLVARLFLMLTPTMNRIGRLSLTDFDLIALMFDVALFALLVHPQSRSYERIWFKK